MLLQDLTTAAVLDSLASKLCPACAGKKHCRQTLCGRCYSALAFPLQRALYRRLGSGYQEAVVTAMKALRRGEFHLVFGSELEPPALSNVEGPVAASAPSELLFDPKPVTREGMPA